MFLAALTEAAFNCFAEGALLAVTVFLSSRNIDL